MAGKKGQFTPMRHRKCRLCGKPVILIPSATERARKDHSGMKAKYYLDLFPNHVDCILKNREQLASPQKMAEKDNIINDTLNPHSELHHRNGSMLILDTYMLHR